MQKAQLNLNSRNSRAGIQLGRALLQTHGRYLGLLLVAVLLLSGCTRNRPAPDSDGSETGVVTQAGEATAAVAPQTDANSQSGAGNEPGVVVTTPETGAPVEPPTAAQGSGADPVVEIEEPTAASEQPTVEAPVAVPTAPPPDAFPYTVTAGDTVSSIAGIFGVAPEAIRELNFLATDNIQPGQILRIPSQPGAVPPPADAASESGPYVHVVQPGDTLYQISVQYDTSAGDIIAANGLSTPDDILVGQELIIPDYQPTEGETAEAEQSGGQVVHVVQPGDQLFAIAERYGVATAELIAANNIQNPGLLRIGQRLIIPGVTELQAAAATGRLHVVQPGEGLGQIAAAYGVTIEGIARLNNLGNVEIIYPGQELIIPGE